MVHTSLIPWLDPETIISAAGPWALVVVCAIVFAETGLLVGFLLPGDTLLVISGLLTNTSLVFGVDIWWVCLAIGFAAFLGGEVGYLIGHKFGPSVFERKESGLFSVKNVERTNAFFERFGALAIILARFVPIVRTFITVTAGVGKMDRRKYLGFSAIGAVLWATGITTLGYFLGSVEFIHDNLEAMAILIVLISLIPMAFEVFREHRRRTRETEAEIGARAEDVVREAEQR